MRNVRTQQLELGEVRIGDIDLDTRSRDDIPALLCAFRPFRPLSPVYSGHRVRLIAANSVSGFADGAISSSE